MMNTSLHKINQLSEAKNRIIICSNLEKLKHFDVENAEIKYFKELLTDEKRNLAYINKFGVHTFIVRPVKDLLNYLVWEKLRIEGDKIQAIANAFKIKEIDLIDADNNKDNTLACAEGLILGGYQFLKYKSKIEDHKHSLEKLNIYSNSVDRNSYNDLIITTSAVQKARDLVNEPVSYLNAERLAEEIENMAIEAGIKVDIFNQLKIESLKMGGLLAVNKGSIDAPTFTVLEWKPENAVNKQPFVFVGKGIVFDTGGLNLKPGSSMTDMKCDMSGAACVSAAIYAIAKAKLPVYVVALVPATDNRPQGNAYAPGDVITMFNGKTVEVLNTDAEGRLILADALSYASKYKPELTIDVATLTGSAHAAIGKYGMVGMHVKADGEIALLQHAGNEVYERIAEFPFWEEYGEEIKSEIADIKNIGSKYAGAITAGKFLENFIDYPWIHLDIAGPAYTEARDAYRGLGGTGVGVRLLFRFIKNKIK